MARLKSFWNPWLQHPLCLPRGNRYHQFSVQSFLPFPVYIPIENGLISIFGQVIFWAMPGVALHIRDYFLRQAMCIHTYISEIIYEI